jgi:predicted transcriptional regulator
MQARRTSLPGHFRPNRGEIARLVDRPYAALRSRSPARGAGDSSVIHFLKKRDADRENRGGPSTLGRLETRVMEILWERGESNVREVAGRLADPLAYTTVMTTLDRLFKKGLLQRHKIDRAFFYSPRLSRRDWERQIASEFVAAFLAGAQTSRQLLISGLLDAVGQHDAALLEELEKKIQSKRKEISAGRHS